MTELIIPIILGLVEGLTEYIPVSSTGHLILAGELLKFNGEKEKAFDVFIQLGAILAVVFLYKERFIELIRSIFPLTKWLDRDTYLNSSNTPLLALLVSASIPPVIIGALLHSKIKSLFDPIYVAWALIFGGIVFLLVEWKKPKVRTITVDSISIKTAFLIGCFQTLALWPGISRSGATIVGAMLLGVEKTVAADFSFFAAVPLIAAAALLDLIKVYSILSSADLLVFATGFIMSFFAGILSITILIGVLKKYSLRPFAYYRIILGGVILLNSYY